MKDLNNTNNDVAVLSMAGWKEKQQQAEQSQEDISMNNYMNVLSFHELIAESNQFLEELNAAPINDDLKRRGQFILKEFKSRLSKEYMGFSGVFSEIVKTIEEKFSY